MNSSAQQLESDQDSTINRFGCSDTYGITKSTDAKSSLKLHLLTRLRPHPSTIKNTKQINNSGHKTNQQQTNNTETNVIVQIYHIAQITIHVHI